MLLRTYQIEEWVYRVLDAVRRGERVEDDAVELKRELPKLDKMAWRIGGHANAARGAPILWIIGVDEETGEVFGPPTEDDASLWARVEAQFDTRAPKPQFVRVRLGDSSVLALCMDTEAAPFVVKWKPPGGDVSEFGVPWRDGTRVRHARREDLVRILAPLVRRPTFEVHDLQVALWWHEQKPRASLEGELYVAHDGSSPVWYPDTAGFGMVTLDGGASFPLVPHLYDHPGPIQRDVPRSASFSRSARDLVVAGSGPLWIGAQIYISKLEPAGREGLDAAMRSKVARVEVMLRSSLGLQQTIDVSLERQRAEAGRAVFRLPPRRLALK